MEAGEVLILEEQGLSVEPGAYLLLALTETGAILCRVGEDEAGELVPLDQEDRLEVASVEEGYFLRTGIKLPLDEEG